MTSALQERHSQSKVAQLAASRALARQMLEGTHLVPTKTCRKCQKPALVKDGALQSGLKGCSGTAVVPEIAICLDETCGHVAVRRHVGMADLDWRYGAAQVELVDGRPHVMRHLPQPITAHQRASLQDFLIQTA